MGTVSGHQLSTFSSPVNGTSPIDANTVRGNDNTIKTSYNAHDADVTIHLQSGAVASRPSASTANQTWLATDTGAVYLYLDTGSAWVDVNYVKTDSAGSAVITSAAAAALAVGPNGATNPAFQVDDSTASQAAGLKVTGAIAAGTVALAVISSGSNANLSLNAKGTGTIAIGSVSTGAVTITPASTHTGLATFNGGATIASGQTLTVTGATITGLTAASVGAGTFTGSFTFATGPSVTSGTTALQAVTATTVTASGTITSNAASAAFQATGASTAVRYIELGNTGGLGTLLIASSTGGLPSGVTPYATTLYSENATPLELGTNATVRLSISSAGAFDFKSGAATFGNTVSLTASTTARASLNIASGTAPTSPNDGDVWFDGTNVKIRVSGVTKTFTIT